MKSSTFNLTSPVKKAFSPFFLALLFWSLGSQSVFANPAANRPAYFELKVYHIINKRQEAVIDSFLQWQYIPSMQAAGINDIGVFKPVGNDTTADKRIYVFIPFKSLKQWEKIEKETTSSLKGGDGEYANAAYNRPAYSRVETIFIKAFDDMTALAIPKFEGPKNERVYELRSYEGASEKIFRNKVQMFNAGGEIKLFSRLNFNGIFYGEVVFGSKMPNLMYMTSFKNMQSREEHWKAFSSDSEWKKLSAMKEYQNNVSHIDIVFLRPTTYSGI